MHDSVCEDEKDGIKIRDGVGNAFKLVLLCIPLLESVRLFTFFPNKT